MIFSLVRMNDRIVQKQEIRTRCWKKLDVERAKEEAKTLQWDGLFLSNDINIINDIMIRNILSILEKEAPMRTVQVRKNYKTG